MAWTTFPERSGSDFSAVEGRRNLRAPDVVDTELLWFRLPGCAGCARGEAHDPCHGWGVAPDPARQRWEHVAAGYRLDEEFLLAVSRAAWLLGYIQDGYPHNLAWNYGEAGNVEQAEVYEIKGVSGATLTLSGANPKRLSRNVATLNPDWPSTAGRLVYSAEYFALPVGAACAFLAPSCYAEKGYEPYVARVNYPESDDATVEFTVELSASAANCLEPADEKFPSGDGKYYVRIYWNQDAKDAWPNWQANRGAVWTRNTLRVAEPGVVSLTSRSGGAARVMWPDMQERALLVYYVDGVGRRVELEESAVLARLETEQAGEGAWATTLDLSDIEGTDFEIYYRPEAESADDPDLTALAGQCANAQRDHAADGEWFCARPDSSGAGDFAAGCWQPGCDGFCLGDERAGYRGGAMADAPSEARFCKWFDGLFHRGDWYIEQLIPGVGLPMNYRVGRPAGGGPSLGGILGGFADSCPTGNYPMRWNLRQASMGKLVEAEETNPADPQYGTTLSLAVGMIVARTEQDVTAAAEKGALWDALGWSVTEPVWFGATDLYTYGVTVYGWNRRVKEYPDQEAYLAAMDVTKEDATLANEIRGRFS